MLSGKRVLVVEDEVFLRLDLESMLEDLGCVVVASASHLDEALRFANSSPCDLAVLDVNLGGQRVDPVADVLAARGIPFVFTTGYGVQGQPAAHRSVPVLEKPYSPDLLAATLARI